MLTKERRLEIESCILRSRLAKVKKALDEFDNASPERIHNGTAKIECRARIGVAVDYEKLLQEELEWAEWLLERCPGLDWEEFLQRRTPGSSPEQKGE